VAAVDERCDRGKADGPAPEDGDTLTLAGFRLFSGVHPDGQGLGKRCDIERDVVRNRVQQAAVGLAHQQLRGQSTLRTSASDAAELLVAGLHHHAVADRDGGDTVADDVDDARHLVAQAQRSTGGATHAPHADVAQVAAADPAGGDPDDGVVRTRFGSLDVVDPGVIRTVDSYLSHRSSPVSRRGSRRRRRGCAR
jgi:hypothetical protein